MKAPGENPGASLSPVEGALLDYFSAPGKYQLVLGEPEILFSCVRDVLQVAAGRSASGAGEQADRVREAARFFIRAALLYPGADHYAVMGVPRGAEPADLKERYRLLMRLIHPDFAGDDSTDWPADAAVRVNRAYEVLSSPVLRREYGEQLASARPPPAPAAAAPVHPPARPLRVRPLRGSLSPKAAWALGLALAGIAILLLAPPQEPAHLVQSTGQRRIPDEPAGRPLPWEPPAAVVEAPAAKTPDPAVVFQGAGPPAAAPRDAQARPAASNAAAQASRQAGTPGRILPAQSVPAAPLAAPASHAPPAPGPVPVAAGSATMAMPRAPEVAVTTPPAAQSTQPEAPAAPVGAPPARAPVAISTTAAASRVSLPLAAAAAPTLGEAQPLLTQLLQLLETGSGDQLLRLLEPGARQAAAAQQLSRQYDRLVHGARPVRLSHADFESEAKDGVLLVTGRLRLHAGEPTIGSRGQLLLLRAEFAARDGRVMLTALSGAAE